MENLTLESLIAKLQEMELQNPNNYDLGQNMRKFITENLKK